MITSVAEISIIHIYHKQKKRSGGGGGMGGWGLREGMLLLLLLLFGHNYQIVILRVKSGSLVQD
jgi:hypothetical protein